jgi:hypothetical protein
LGHVVASHVQAPLVLSHMPFAHVPHAFPPAPHSEGDCPEYGMHAPAAQQPLGQEAGPHPHEPDDVSHDCPAAHAEQLAPPAPHAVADCPA